METRKAPREAEKRIESSVPSRVVVQEVQYLAPKKLRPNPRNARRHSKRQIAQIAAAIKTTGFVGTIIVDEDLVILAGHGRREAALLEGMAEVPVLVVSGLSDAQKRAFVLADNKIPQNAGWDREVLLKELGELAELFPDMTITGFEPGELNALMVDLDGEKSDPADSVPEMDESAVARSGDVWLLGPHRVACGDARNAADVDRLMTGERARMVFADPPFNVRVKAVQGRGRIKHREFAFASGEMSEADYVAFLINALGNASRVSRQGALHYVCTDWRHVAELVAAGRKLYTEILNICVWCKGNAGQGSLYRSQHELIGVFQVGRGPHENNIQLGRFGRNRSNVWNYAGVNQFGADRLKTLAMHPTVKPVALVADAMRDCTSKGDPVLDPFLGSGTTLLAAEKIGRRCYGVEYEPRFVDVTIARWESYTKGDAILEGDGRTYDEVKAARLSTTESNLSATEPSRP